jgi:hypothetical protein
MRRALSLTLVLMSTTPALAAQVSASRIRGPTPSILFRAASTRGAVAMPDSVQGSVPPTQWKHGMLIGGIIGGVGGIALGFAWCGLSETQTSCLSLVLAGTVGGALLGGTIGALIGGQFPKHPRAPADSSSAGQ